MVARGIRIAGLLLSFPVRNLVTPPRRRERLRRKYARKLLTSLGIELRIRDNRATGAPRTVTESDYSPSGAGVLVVTGHIGWTDIVALAAVQPLGFVARADMLDWPLLGGLAKLMRVIPIERERLRALPGVVAAIGARLAAGDRIAVFPEGTTWCGRAYGTMRPALFQAAVETATPVQPVRLRYLDRHGAQSTVPGFVGIDTFGTSAARVLRSRGLIVEIVLEPLEWPGEDRRELARRVERAVRGTEPSVHGQWIEAGATRVQDPEVAAESPEVVRPRRRLRAPALLGRHRVAEGDSASVTSEV